MTKAIWNGVVVAESDQTIVVENNHYFPPASVRSDMLHASEQTSVCPWKGTASYLSLELNGEENAAAAWYYPQPKLEAAQIKDYVAFWKGVEVTD